MAIELPGPVADFLGFIGINWPNVNEDHVREFGEHIAQFATDLGSIHQGGTETVSALGQAYQGESYEKLFATWGQMSSEHMTVLLDGCHILAEACQVGATVIVGEKLAAIAQLVIMAIEFIEAQAAAAATFGIAEAAVVLIQQQGRMVIKFLEQEIEQYIEGQLIEAAAGPLFEKISQVVSGMVYRGTAEALGQHSSAGNSSVPQFHIDPAQVFQLAGKFREHGDQAERNGSSFSGRVGSLSFSD